MSTNFNQNQNRSQKTESNHSDDYSAWGLIGGGLLGAGVGAFFDKALALAILVGVVGWLVGAFVDRSRR